MQMEVKNEKLQKEELLKEEASKEEAPREEVNKEEAKNEDRDAAVSVSGDEIKRGESSDDLAKILKSMP